MTLFIACITAALAAPTPVYLLVQEVGGDVQLATGTRAAIHQQQALEAGDRLLLKEGATLTVAVIAPEPPAGTLQTWAGPTQVVATHEGVRGKANHIAEEKPLTEWDAVALVSVASSLRMARETPEGLRGSNAPEAELTADEEVALKAAKTACDLDDAASVPTCVRYAGLLIATQQTAEVVPVLRSVVGHCSDCTGLKALLDGYSAE